jgi:diadenosine tetraphosphate (Ap4A) HIT family hydrolase
MEEKTVCKACGLIARRDKGIAPLWDNVHRTQYWDVVHCSDTSMLGWMVLVVRRHIASISELTREEAVELGMLQRDVSKIMHLLLKCQKTYVLQFAEGEGFHHVHFHVIPRMKDLPPEERSIKIFRYLGVPQKDRVGEEIMNEFCAEVRQMLASNPS